jgi:hypothetical protein
MSNYDDQQDSFRGDSGLSGRGANVGSQQGYGGRETDSSSYGNSGTTGLSGRGGDDTSYGGNQCVPCP